MIMTTTAVGRRSATTYSLALSITEDTRHRYMMTARNELLALQDIIPGKRK